MKFYYYKIELKKIMHQLTQKCSGCSGEEKPAYCLGNSQQSKSFHICVAQMYRIKLFRLIHVSFFGKHSVWEIIIRFTVFSGTSRQN